MHRRTAIACAVDRSPRAARHQNLTLCRRTFDDKTHQRNAEGLVLFSAIWSVPLH